MLDVKLDAVYVTCVPVCLDVIAKSRNNASDIVEQTGFLTVSRVFLGVAARPPYTYSQGRNYRNRTNASVTTGLGRPYDGLASTFSSIHVRSPHDFPAFGKAAETTHQTLYNRHGFLTVSWVLLGVAATTATDISTYA